MEEFKQITSAQNPLVKKVLSLRDKSRERRKAGLFVLEGRQEIRLALGAGYVPRTLFFNTKICNNLDFLASMKKSMPTVDHVSISREIYQKLAYRETTEGVLALVDNKSHTLEDLEIKNKNPLFLIAEAPEKPGNIGALLRTADAANLDAVIIADPKTDLYNPNIIRSSVGGVFTNQIALASTTQTIAYLKGKDIKIYCAALTASKEYTEVDFTVPSAIVMGTEATGLSPKWLQESSKNIIIPMKGKIDSLNVSVSASILIFEALRQRNSIS